MNLDINNLARFDFDNNGQMSVAERSAHDAYATEEDLTTIEGNLRGLRDDLDIAQLENMDINANRELEVSEMEAFNTFTRENNQINSANYPPSNFELDLDLANAWVENDEEGLTKSDLAFLTLMKEFGSEDMATAIQNNAELQYDGDSMTMNFNVDGVDFTLTTNYDSNGEHPLSSILTNNEDISNSGIYFNEEDGVAFNQNYEDENGVLIGEWESNNYNHISENGLIVSGTSGGISFTRDDIVDNANFTQTNEDGTVLIFEDDLITGGTYNDGTNFTRTNVSADNLNYTETYDNGDYTNVEGGFIQSGSHQGTTYTRTNVEDNQNYSQRNFDGTFVNVEDGLIRSGTYSNGVEFTRSGVSEDNMTYTDTYNNGSTINVQNGLIVGGTYEGGSYHRTNVVDNMNYSQRNQDGTYINVEDGLIRSGVYNNGVSFNRTYAADNSTYTDTYADGTSLTLPNPGFDPNSVNNGNANEGAGTKTAEENLDDLYDVNEQLSEFISMDIEQEGVSEAELQVDREQLMDELLQSTDLDSINRPNLVAQKEAREAIADLNEMLLGDLETELAGLENDQTELGRASATNTRIQIEMTSQLIDFHRGNADFYQSLLDA
ncbi:MAG: hypothetical protein MK033_06965 [Candidatus Caenarcaniphilales bacterium]|nr:hypothetical protein [Candidatus Caenarcaniphilales bacterium]